MDLGSVSHTAGARRVLASLLLLLLCLAPHPLCLAHAAMAPGPDMQEVEVMRKLRRAVHAADAKWTAGWRGWGKNDTSHPCTWKLVNCDAQQRITFINLWGPPGSLKNNLSPATVLLPELAQLQQLQMLRIERLSLPLSTGLPPEWLVPGAFPRLTELLLGFAAAGAPLPDIQPGAFPQLQSLTISIRGLQSPLPASWHLLPSLSSLVLHLNVIGDLPAKWAAGFPQLSHMIINNEVPVDCGTMGAVPAGSRPSAASNHSSSSQAPAPAASAEPGAVAHRLPVEWASGFPNLTVLSLSNFTFASGFPPEWLVAFPRLETLSLSLSCLRGPLPAGLFTFHPALSHVSLQYNQFTGTLPAAWGDADQAGNIQLGNNQLSGPAFPPAWTRPGALPQLEYFSARSNPLLNGTFPANLPWPRILELDMWKTAVLPSIPAGWCKPLHAGKLQRIGIGSDDVQPHFPPCAATSLPDLIVNGVFHNNFSLPSSSPASTPLNPLALAASLAATAAGALAAVVATKLMHERRRRLRRLSVWGASGVHLLSSHSPSSDSEQSSPGSSKQASAAGGLGLAAFTQRAQLAAFMQARLGTRSNQSIRLTAHCFQRPAPRQLGLPKPGDIEACLPQDAAEDQQGTRLLLAPGTPGVFQTAPVGWGSRSIRNGSAGSGSGSGSSGGVAGSSPGANQTLPKDSLRMQLGELEFVVDAEGLLVQLGCGSQAAVYLARLQRRQVAVKVFMSEGSSGLAQMWAEVTAMRRCVHPRIVPLYGVAVQGPMLMLVMEAMEGGSLKEALCRPGTHDKLRWGAGGRQVALDVAEGLHYLHSVMSMMHGDLKPSNVLLSTDGRACLADLGFAQVLGSKAACNAAGFTPTYAAPEQLIGQLCTLAADMYSFGILLVELTTLEPSRIRGELRLPQAPQECPSGVVQLIQSCLAQDPTERPTAAEALQCLQACA